MAVNDNNTAPNGLRDPHDPYKAVGPWPKRIKAVLQMLVGICAVVLICCQLIAHSEDSMTHIQDITLSSIGLALAVAAAIELAYTLFTPGPDEALDPLMLGLAAALILQLGRVDNFHWTQGLAALLYVSALAALFGVRKYLLLCECPDSREAHNEATNVPDDSHAGRS